MSDVQSSSTSPFSLAGDSTLDPSRRSEPEPFLIDALGVRSDSHWKRNLVSRSYPYALLVIDFLLLGILYLGSVYVNYDGHVFQEMSRKVLFVIAFTNALGLYLIGGYSYRVDKRSFRFASEYLIMASGVVLTALTLIYVFIFYGKSLNTARSTVFFPLLTFPVLAGFYRYVLGHAKARFEVGNAFCLIGTGVEARDLYRRLIKKESKHTFVVVDPSEKRIGHRLVAEDSNSPIIRSANSLMFNSSVEGKFVEGYVVTVPVKSLPSSFANRLAVSKFRGNNIYTYDSYFVKELRMVPHSRLSPEWPLSDGFLLNKSMIYDRLKRLSDIAASVIGLILLWPLLAVTALAVKLTSEGPIIFCQTRVGYRQKPFKIYKFRTMKVGSEKGPKYTAKKDSRLTPIGAFLRKTRIDELPQLVNVLKGDLSLIGPRAEWIDLVNEYESKFPYYHFRHAVKPGITGWAQVNYPYGENDYDTLEKLNYDLYYVRKYSFVLDVSICVKTLYTMIFGMGR